MARSWTRTTVPLSGARSRSEATRTYPVREPPSNSSATTATASSSLGESVWRMDSSLLFLERTRIIDPGRQYVKCSLGKFSALETSRYHESEQDKTVVPFLILLLFCKADSDHCFLYGNRSPLY